MKTKQLVFETNIHTAWQQFLGDKYIVRTGMLNTRAIDGFLIKTIDPFIRADNGIIYIEYENKETGVIAIILQNEWFVEKNGKIEHLTTYVYENFDKFYDENLIMLPFDENYNLIEKQNLISMKKFNVIQMCQIAHALGIDLYKANKSHKKKDKTLPSVFYRNRFQIKHDDSFEEIVSMNYAVKTEWQDLPFYFVNVDGVLQFRKQFAEMFEYKPLLKRDLEYLKKRINIYCDLYNYKFGGDNATHVFSAYVNYYINSYKVSCTTQDVITEFKKELNSYYKKGLLSQFVSHDIK